MNRHLVTWGPALAWALVLFGLSELRSVPAALEPLTRIPPLLIHVMVYTALGLTLAWARLRTGKGGRGRGVGRHAPYLALGIVYGALDEWHQGFVPGRTPSVLDWLADVTGVVIGYGVGLLLLGARGGPGGTAGDVAGEAAGGRTGERGPGAVSTARGPDPRDAPSGNQGNP